MRDHEDDDKKFTITLDSNYTYEYDVGVGSTIDVSSITLDNNWNPNNGKYIDFDVLDKYPTAKTLYNQFISVYTMCEEEEKINGE